MAKKQSQKKNANKHASNTRRHDRKYKRVGRVNPAGNCGSSFCTRATTCDPWKGTVAEVIKRVA